jgi:hypothetical protein
LCFGLAHLFFALFSCRLVVSYPSWFNPDPSSLHAPSVTLPHLLRFKFGGSVYTKAFLLFPLSFSFTVVGMHMSLLFAQRGLHLALVYD